MALSVTSDLSVWACYKTWQDRSDIKNRGGLLIIFMRDHSSCNHRSHYVYMDTSQLYMFVCAGVCACVPTCATQEYMYRYMYQCEHFVMMGWISWTHMHGLSCKWSQGRHSRHAAMRDIIHRSLVSAKIPPIWHYLVPLILMERGLTGCQWFPWPAENCWFGMLPVQTPMLHLT